MRQLLNDSIQFSGFHTYKATKYILQFCFIHYQRCANSSKIESKPESWSVCDRDPGIKSDVEIRICESLDLWGDFGWVWNLRFESSKRNTWVKDRGLRSMVRFGFEFIKEQCSNLCLWNANWINPICLVWILYSVTHR